MLFAQPGWRSEDVSRGFLSEAVSRTVLMDCVVFLQYLVRGICSQVMLDRENVGPGFPTCVKI